MVKSFLHQVRSNEALLFLRKGPCWSKCLAAWYIVHVLHVLAIVDVYSMLVPMERQRCLCLSHRMICGPMKWILSVEYIAFVIAFLRSTAQTYTSSHSGRSWYQECYGGSHKEQGQCGSCQWGDLTKWCSAYELYLCERLYVAVHWFATLK